MQGFLQNLINIAVTVLNAMFGWLPDSPFTFVANSAFSDYISKINYFVPIYEFIAIAQAWLVGVGLYYAVAVILRWLKAVE